MALTYFRGTINFGAMPLTDLAQATAALSVLEGLAERDLIEFEMGVSRQRKIPPAGRGRDLQPQQRRIYDELLGEKWWSSREIAETLGITVNSITSHVYTMVQNGWLEAQSINRKSDGPGRRGTRVYRSIRQAVGPEPEAL